MHRLRLPVALVAVAALACVAGCAATQRRDNLTTTLNAYAETLRWGDFAHALEYVDPAYREVHPLTPLQRARYRQVRVAGYDEGQGPVPVGPDEVRQTVKIGLINRHTQRERFVIDHQIWKWDAEAKHWWLETGLPDITHAPDPT